MLKDFMIYKEKTDFSKVYRKPNIGSYKVEVGDIIKFRTDMGNLYVVVSNKMEKHVKVILLTEFIQLKTANDSRVYCSVIDEEILIQYDIIVDIPYDKLHFYGTKIGSLDKLDIFDMKMTVHLTPFNFKLNDDLQKRFKIYEKNRIEKLLYLISEGK